MVHNLIPFTKYQLRLIAVNVVGPSEPSEATKEFETLQAPPAHPPWNVTVRAMSAKELRVRWIVSVAWLNVFPIYRPSSYILNSLAPSTI